MSRNRKSQSAAIRFRPALKAFLLCLLIGGSGIGYVWQKEQIARLGQVIKSKEITLNDLERRNEVSRRQLGKMRTPGFLELQIRKSNLGLSKPQDSQILRLTEPVPVPTRPSQETQYAARSENTAFGQ